MKKDLGAVNALYPSLTVIVGTVVGGKDNFLAIAHLGILNHGSPQYLSFGVNKNHYSVRGILENRTFSVNVPGEDLMLETDYVGIVSGKNTDKSGMFETFTGVLENAPMIAACPVCMQCRLHDVLDYKTHSIFIGEIAGTYAEERVLNEKGKIDVAAVKPLLFDMGTTSYYALGERKGGCWNVGKALKK